MVGAPPPSIPGHPTFTLQRVISNPGHPTFTGGEYSETSNFRSIPGHPTFTLRGGVFRDTQLSPEGSIPGHPTFTLQRVIGIPLFTDMGVFRRSIPRHPTFTLQRVIGIPLFTDITNRKTIYANSAFGWTVTFSRRPNQLMSPMAVFAIIADVGNIYGGKLFVSQSRHSIQWMKAIAKSFRSTIVLRFRAGRS